MQCPLCFDEKCEQVHDRVWSLEDGRVLRCLTCDVTFLDPMMNDQEEKAFYQNYNKHVMQRGVTTSGLPEELHQKSALLAVERFAKIREFFSEAERVLEIGPSTGAFLQLLEGKSCVAVEPDDKNRDFCSRFADQVYSDLANVPEEELFDVICMFHVFEHIRRPADFLDQCRRHLAPGGLIAIEVPHIDDPLIKLYNCSAYKDFYFQPMHPFVHSLKSLRHVFFGQRFREKRVIFHQRYGLDNHLNWLAAGTPGGNAEWKKILGENEGYKSSLEKAGRSDTIFYIVEDSVQV